MRCFLIVPALWFLNWHLASGFTLFTVGKNKTAKVINLYSEAENPNLANDGNREGNYTAGLRCFHNKYDDPKPWWMVDMEMPYIIYGASVWNRINLNNAARFTQISIGVTLNPSVWTTYNTGILDLCMYYTGVPTAADNPINFTCSRPIAGRYLVVRKNITGVTYHLHFCEIDIIAMSKEASFDVTEVQPSFSPSSSSLVFYNPVDQMSEAECLIRCSLLPSCLFALIRAATLDCWLFGSIRINSSFSGVYSSIGTRFLAVYG